MSKTMEQIYSSTCSSQSSNLFVEEVVINDASSSARDFLTQRSTQKEISELSGASISMRGVYKPPGEENTNSTTKPLYLHIEGLSKSDVRIAAGRIIHLKKECSHIKEETPPTQHQGSSVASTSTVPQVPDEKVRRTAEIRRKDSGKPTSLMTVDPPFKSSPQQNILVVGHSWVSPFVRHAPSHLHVSQGTWPGSQLRELVLSAAPLLQERERRGIRFDHLIVFGVLTEAYEKIPVTGPRNNTLGHLVWPREVFQIDKLVESTQRLVREVQEVSPHITIWIVVPPVLDLVTANEIAYNSPEVSQELYDRFRRDYSPKYQWQKAKEVYNTLKRITEECMKMEGVRSFPIQHVTQSIHRLKGRVVAFMKGKFYSRPGYLTDGIHPTGELCQAMWLKIMNVLSQPGDRIAPLISETTTSASLETSNQRSRSRSTERSKSTTKGSRSSSRRARRKRMRSVNQSRPADKRTGAIPKRPEASRPSCRTVIFSDEVDTEPNKEPSTSARPVELLVPPGNYETIVEFVRGSIEAYTGIDPGTETASISLGRYLVSRPPGRDH